MDISPNTSIKVIYQYIYKFVNQILPLLACLLDLMAIYHI